MVAQSVMTGCYLGTGVLLGVDRARSGAQTAAADEIDRSGAGAPLPFAMTVEPAPRVAGVACPSRPPSAIWLPGNSEKIIARCAE